jgi:hypothetical protein
MIAHVSFNHSLRNFAHLDHLVPACLVSPPAILVDEQSLLELTLVCLVASRIPYAPERLLQMALTLRVRLATDGIPCAAPVLPHGPRGTFRLEDIHAE